MTEPNRALPPPSASTAVVVPQPLPMGGNVFGVGLKTPPQASIAPQPGRSQSGYEHTPGVQAYTIVTGMPTNTATNGGASRPDPEPRQAAKPDLSEFDVLRGMCACVRPRPRRSGR